MKTDKIPLAYFITFRTYASWLHGDIRLSVSRTKNIYNTPKINPNKNLETQMHDQKKHELILLSKKQGDIILESTVEVCNKYQWRLHSLHVRSNHVHLTVSANEQPEIIMTRIKARATFYLRKQGEFSKSQKIWARHGSTKYLWSPESLYFATEYTTELQGQKMAYVYDLK
jgi:REP element-mobilizing transposase RayT